MNNFVSFKLATSTVYNSGAVQTYFYILF